MPVDLVPVRMIGLKANQGLTVIELLVAMAIAAVMLTYAIPAFNDFSEQRRITSGANMMIAGVNYARNEAARLGTTVTLQSLNAVADNEWGAGFCVTANNPGNCDNALNVFEPDAVLTMDGVDGLDGLDRLSFNSRGMLVNTPNGQVTVCGPDEDSDPGREVRLNMTGRASSGEFTCFEEE